MKSLLFFICLARALAFFSDQDVESSCLAYNISKGETLDSDCEGWCSPYSYGTFDWGAPSEDDANIIDRNTVCRCLDDTSGAAVGECLDVEPSVWDLSVGVPECDEYNITSGTTCEEFCLPIDPVAFKYSISGGEVQCSCADPPFKVCGTSGSARMGRPGAVTFGSAIVLAAVLAVSSVLV
jgi:hypothetical protein